MKPDLARTDSEKRTTTTTPSHTPQKRVATSGNTTPTRAPNTPGSQDAFSLNLSLETILQATLRPEESTMTPDSTTQKRYLGDLLDRSGEPLTVQVFSEVVCARLTGHSDVLNAVSFLVGCYKRLIARECSVSGNVLRDLIK
jgi:hypothetical protein